MRDGKVWEKILELVQGYGLAGFFFAIAISYVVRFIQTEYEPSLLWPAIGFAVIGSIAAFLTDISKAILKPVIEQLGEPIANTIVRWLGIFFVRLTSPFQRDYYKALLFKFSDYRTHGLTGGSRVPELERMFVPLGITSPEVEEISASLIQANNGEERYTIWDFLVDGVHDPSLRHQTLLAPPGSGKTTLLKHLIVTYVRNAQRTYHRRAPALIPVFISLREVCTTVARSHPPLPRLIERQELVRRCKPPAQWFDTRLAKGRCLVMFDGLDEVADAQDRQAVGEWINAQIAAFPDNYVIVTSRPLGYQSIQLHAIRRVLRVEPFTLKQIEAFIHSWYLQNELLRLPQSGVTRASRRQARKTAHTRAITLFDRIKDNRALAAMALNPLLLTMMTTVYNYRAAVPNNRVRLYDAIYQVLIEQRQRDRDIYNEAIAIQTRQLLQTLALAMMEHNTQEYHQTADNLSFQPTLQHILGEEASLDDFLAQTDSAHGFLVKKTEGVYEFAHESFQNYLAAVEIREQGAEAALLQRVSDDWWFDTLYLYAEQNNDGTAIVKAALDCSTVESLTLAYTLNQDRVPIAPSVAQQLQETIDEGLRSPDPSRFRLAAEVRLSNRLNQLMPLNEQIDIDPRHITQAEYQLFLDESSKPLYPDHWTSDTHSAQARQRFLPDDAQVPITGIRADDAQTFCDWLTQRQPHAEPRFRYRLPRLIEIRDHPSQEPGIGCWCADLRDTRVAGLRPKQWQTWQGTFSTHLQAYVERDRTHLQYLTHSPDFQLSLDLESDTGFQLIFDPSLDVRVALQQVSALDLSRALSLARSRPITTALTNRDLHATIRTCDRTITRRETRSFNRDALLNRNPQPYAQTRDFQAVRCYLLLAAEFWQALADAHANLAQNRQQQRFIRFLPMVMTRMLNHPLNRIRSECNTQRDRVMNLYAFFALLEARREGIMPAWEGIRVVREAVRRSPFSS